MDTQSSPLSNDLKQFVKKNFSSAEEIDVLVLMATPPLRPWSIPAITAQLQTSESSIKARLHALLQRGLVDADPAANTFQFNTANARVQKLVAELRNAYQTYRHRLAALIFEK